MKATQRKAQRLGGRTRPEALIDPTPRLACYMPSAPAAAWMVRYARGRGLHANPAILTHRGYLTRIYFPRPLTPDPRTTP